MLGMTTTRDGVQNHREPICALWLGQSRWESTITSKADIGHDASLHFIATCVCGGTRRSHAQRATDPGAHPRRVRR